MYLGGGVSGDWEKEYEFLSHQRTLITGFRDPIKADPSVYLDASYKLRDILM